MPHQCNNCEKVYPDGCEAILDGCTDCGNKRFQYIPESVADTEPTVSEMTTQSDPKSTEPNLKPTKQENESQARARTDIVDQSELPDRSQDTTDESDLLHPEEPQIEEILNDQFEGITVLEKGKYELNISEIFNGESKIIKIQEDGKYVVDVSETFKSL